jgi:predicted O-methyltransferase YrrM
MVSRPTLMLSGQHKLARGLDRRSFALEAAIEEQRRLLLADNRPLSDGTHGSPNRFDHRTISEACRASKPSWAARCLYSLAAEYKAATIIELGTNLGISAAYLAAAGGCVTTLEGSAYRLRIAKQMHERLGLSNISYVEGLFSETLPRTLTQMPPIDLAFIDGHHEYQPTLDYFTAIRSHASETSLFVFDDIRWSDEMKTAWAELKGNFSVVTEAGGMGVALYNR